LTFRTPLASSNRLRHFFNAQATNNNNNNKRRSARSFETEVTEENLASRASKSRESSRPKNDDDDVKKEKQIQSFFFFVPGRSEIHASRETKDNKQTKIVVTPKHIHHRALERALLPTGRGGPLAVLWIWIFATCACACLLVAFTFLEKNGTKERDFRGLMKKNSAKGLSDDADCSYEKIDFQSVKNRVVEKIETATVERVPFSHVFVKGIFSERVYACVLRHLANKDTEENLTYAPMANWPGRNSIPLIDKFGKVKAKEPSFWGHLSRALGSDEVKSAYVRKFGATMERRFGGVKVERVLQNVRLNHRLDLTRDTSGYSIPPHTDTNEKAVSILYYLAFPETSNTSVGTRMYASKNKRDDGIRYPPRGSTSTPSKNFNNDFEEVESIPFVPNVVFAFAPCWSSWHGVENIGNGERDTIQGFVTIEELVGEGHFDKYGSQKPCVA